MNDPFWEHKDATYRNLRKGMLVIAFVFPVFLWAVGDFWYGVDWQPSMSAYYGAHPRQGLEEGGWLRANLVRLELPPIGWLLGRLNETEGATPMRTWFVGTLFVLGFFLILYEGIDRWDNLWLNLAGGGALLVALFPAACDVCSKGPIHTTAAVLSFVLLAVVACKTAIDRFRDVQGGDASAGVYRGLYLLVAVLMVAGPLGALAMSLDERLLLSAHAVFLAEAIGLWGFGAYWFILSAEMRRDQGDPVIKAVVKALDPVVTMPKRGNG